MNSEAEFRARVAALSLEKLGEMNPQVRMFLEGSRKAAEMPEATNPHPEKKNRPKACPDAAGHVPVMSLARELTIGERTEFAEMVAALRRYQMALGITNRHFVARLPLLGSEKTWGFRLAVGDFSDLKLRKWYPRVQAIVAHLNVHEPGWDALRGPPTSLDQLQAGVARLAACQYKHKMSDAAMASKAGFGRSSWLRLKQGQWGLIPLHTWCGRVKTALERLGA